MHDPPCIPRHALTLRAFAGTQGGEFQEMKASGRLKFGQVPALEVKDAESGEVCVSPLNNRNTNDFH